MNYVEEMVNVNVENVFVIMVILEEIVDLENVINFKIYVLIKIKFLFFKILFKIHRIYVMIKENVIVVNVFVTWIIVVNIVKFVGYIFKITKN